MRRRSRRIQYRDEKFGYQSAVRVRDIICGICIEFIVAFLPRHDHSNCYQLEG